MATEEQLDKLLESLGKLTATQADVLASLLKKDKAMASAGGALGKAISGSNALDASLKKLNSTVKLTTDQFNALNKAMGGLGAGVGSFVEGMEVATDKVGKSADEFSKAVSNNSKTFNKSVNESGDKFEVLKKRLAGQIDGQQDLAKNIGESGDKFSELKERLGHLGDGVNKGGSMFGKSTSMIGSAAGYVGEKLKNVGNAITSTFKSIISGGSNFTPSKLVDSLITPVLGEIPIFGKLLAGASGILGTLIGYFEETFNAFRTLTSSGYQAGANLGDLQKAAAATGLTLTEFQGFITSNSQALSNFGAGVNAGVDKFNKVFQPIIAPLGKYNSELKGLGYTTSEMQGVIGSFIEMTNATGESQRLSNEQLTQSAIEVMREVDTVARLTGKTREAIAKELAATAKQTPAVERMMQLLGPEVAKRAGLAMTALGDSPALKAGFLEAITTGGKVIGPELSKIASQMPGLTRDIMEYGRVISEGGTVSNEQIQQMMARAKQEAESRGLNSQAIAQAMQLGAANGNLNDMLLALNEVTRYSVKDLSNLNKGAGASVQAMVTFEQIMSEISRIFRSIFLPTLETGLMPALKMFAGMLEDTKERVGDFGPKIQAAAEGLATRLAMLFDEEGRSKVFGEVKGYLKLLLAELIDAMSGTLLGKALGATKSKAEVVRAEGRADIAAGEAEAAQRKADYKAGGETRGLERERARLQREIKAEQDAAAAGGRSVDATAVGDRERRIAEITKQIDSLAADAASKSADAQKAIQEANAKAAAAKLEVETAQQKAERVDAAGTVGGTAAAVGGTAAVAGLYALAGGAAATGVGIPLAAALALAAGGISYFLGKGAAASAAEKGSVFATGGIADMPTQGGLALLHGREAVVPLPDGNSIPVTMTETKTVGAPADSVNNRELIFQVAQLNERMDKLIAINEEQHDVLGRQLRIAKDMSPL